MAGTGEEGVPGVQGEEEGKEKEKEKTVIWLVQITASGTSTYIFTYTEM